MHFQKKLGKGLFGGEGFIMQKLSGNGIAFIEIDGYGVEYTLEAGQQMVVDTGYLAAMEETCTMDVVKVPGVKNMLLGGEGIFNTVIKGPGKIILQTMPITKVAELLQPFFTETNIIQCKEVRDEKRILEKGVPSFGSCHFVVQWMWNIRRKEKPL